MVFTSLLSTPFEPLVILRYIPLTLLKFPELFGKFEPRVTK
jgi:hypothetical protein